MLFEWQAEYLSQIALQSLETGNKVDPFKSDMNPVSCFDICPENNIQTSIVYLC